MGKRNLGAALLAVAGLVNAAPALGALSAKRLWATYGLDDRGEADRNLDVLLQHRGVLFLVTGGLLVVAVPRPHLRAAAITANATSCAAFVMLAMSGGLVNPQLSRLMWIDVGVLTLLAGGGFLTRPASGPASGQR
jgi:hypothetical protein